MTTDCGALAALLATLTMLGATPTAAQTSQTEQTPQPAPVRGLEALGTPQATQIPVPDAPKIVLPGTTSRGRTKTVSVPAAKAAAKPSAKPLSAASDDRSASRPAGKAASRPRPSSEDASSGNTSAADTAAESRAASTTTLAPTATPARTPAPSASSDVAPSSTPTPAPTQESTLAAPETGRAMPLWLSLAVIVVVLAGLWFLRRRKPASRYDRVEPEVAAKPIPDPVAKPVAAEPVVPEPIAAPIASTIKTAVVPAVAAPTAPKFLEPRAKSPPVAKAAPRARIACELRPLRAGLNLLSATVECELVVTNTGDAPAEAIRAGVSLLTAHAGQDTDLAAFNAAPVVRPVAAPFALAPGETRTLRTVVAVAREAIRTMTAANRPMFVPVVAANLRYVTTGDDAQTARAWSIGIERVDSPKLAPFWLDAPARMYSSVAARPHATEFVS